MKSRIKTSAATIAGVVFAIVFVCAGLLIPKALLAKQENGFVGKSTTIGTPITTEVVVTPLPTRPPEGAHELDEDRLYFLVEFMSGLDLNEMPLREPLPQELNMEVAVGKAREELDLMIGYGAIPEIGAARLRLVEARLYGAAGMNALVGGAAEPEWPSGVWKIDFDDAGGDGLVSSVICDSQTGLILSVWLDKVTDAFSASDCYSFLMRYAEYLGCGGRSFQCVFTGMDLIGYVVEANGAWLSMRQVGDEWNIRIAGDYTAISMPTPAATARPTPTPTATPIPTPTPTPAPAGEQESAG